MPASRRGGRGRPSTPVLAFWAAVMLLLGLGLGVFLSHSFSSRKVHRPTEKASEPTPKHKVTKQVLEPTLPEPEPTFQAPEQVRGPEKPEKIVTPEKVQKPEKIGKSEPTPKPEKQVKQPEKPAKQPEKQPAKPLKSEKAQTPEIRPQSPLPKIALVIDDLGYAQPEWVTRLCKESVPFSVAVLPYQEFTRESAEIAFSRGKEVMLHLPMEPIGYPGPG